MIFNMAGRWFNAAAVEWVVYEAPADLPPGLLLTLAVVASFAGTDGRAAYPSAATVAMLTHKSEKQARRDIHDLVKRGLLVKGDRRVVEKLRADRRPDVYDLPAQGQEYLGRHRRRGDATSPRTGSRLDTHGESSMSTREADDWTSAPGRLDTNRLHDSPPMSTEEFLKNSGKGAPPPAVGGADGGGAPESRNPAPAALAAEPARCADPRCRGSRFPVDPETGMHDECKGFARFRAVRTR